MPSRPVDRWTHECSIETSASPEAVWRLFEDVPGWKRWNAGIEHIEIHGPFAPGTRFRMTLPGGEAFGSTLVDVDPGKGFTDETPVGDLVVRVAHRIEPLDRGRVRIVYAVEALGPECEEVGMAVTSDFADVLRELARLAESAT